ncbi:uncharacterized protein LOC119314416 [Triticum dicoccoides]|uniref:uncharacterized protein LOC119314416 n=1 Tax=Triticum dicoccoides TaxID=85692 RepID=UPI0018912CDE|nr:uncharacterized protein LOC119314416 [Triticum dicoccoides]
MARNGAKKVANKKKKQKEGAAKLEIEEPQVRRPPNCRCIALKEQIAYPSKSVTVYVEGLANDITEVGEPAGEFIRPQNPEGNLIPPAQKIFLRIIHMTFDEIEAGWPFSKLNQDTVIVTELDVPLLREDNRVEASDATVASCVNQLANMLHSIINAASPSYAANPSVNKDLQHLIKLIREYQRGASSFLIRYHATNLPIINRCQTYIKMFDHVTQILRFTDPEAYNVVMKAVEVPAGWDGNVVQNEFLALYFYHGHYDPTGTKPTTDPVLEPLRYMRHCPSHVMLRGGLVAFTRTDLGFALYQRMPQVVLSMQMALQRLGELKYLGTESDFQGLLRIQI